MADHRQAISRLLEQDDFPADAFYVSRVFEGRKIIVYGAGGGFHWVQEVLINLCGYTPAVVLDRMFTRGDTFNGIPAFSPLDYCPDDDEKKNAIVIICVGKQQYHADIRATLQETGFRNIILLMDIYEIHNPFGLPAELQETGFAFYRENGERILAALELFEDDESREIYTRCIHTHLTRKPIPLPGRAPEEQYTPSDIELKKGYSRYICCGVSSGEMARVLHDIGRVDDFVCFEPNERQFGKLVRYFREHEGKNARHVYAYPCAAYSREAQMRFIYTDDSFGNRISEYGHSQVQCVSIDNVIPFFCPTFISMDIEGAELEALKGAETSIKASRPDLAICVYHAPDHLWKIPLYLTSLGIGYRFYLRNYTTFTSETVLYATT
jgi:FkbM family methyltransferase